MIFRNPAKDISTLRGSPECRGGKLGTSVRFQNAAEIAERDRKIKEQAPARAPRPKRRKKEAARVAAANFVPKVPVTLPADGPR
jgi:hypothetical protein